MAAYHGGWVECALRRWEAPVRVLDIRSTYATIASHLNIQAYLAGSVEVLDGDEARDRGQQLLNTITLKDVLEPTNWDDLVGLVLVDPNDRCLPLRVQTGERTWTSGVFHTTGAPVWVTVGDAIAAKLHTDTVPTVLEAYRFRPRANPEPRQTVAIRGDTLVDPNDTDLFAATVMERTRLEDADLTETERDWRRQSLKTIGNAGAYGIHVRFDRRRRPDRKRERVTLWTPTGREDWQTTRPEDPGPWCAPFLAASITGAARLLLAALEQLITQAGGIIAYRDTDSAFVVANPNGGLLACPNGPDRLPDGTAAIRVLRDDELRAIVARFDRLGIAGPFWKLEKENLRPDGTLRDLRFWGVRSKSYCLSERGADGKRKIIKASDHGLGFLLDPTKQDTMPRPDDEGADDRPTRTKTDASPTKPGKSSSPGNTASQSRNPPGSTCPPFAGCHSGPETPCAPSSDGTSSTRQANRFIPTDSC
jgi:PAS domain-containing protein